MKLKNLGQDHGVENSQWFNSIANIIPKHFSLVMSNRASPLRDSTGNVRIYMVDFFRILATRQHVSPKRIHTFTRKHTRTVRDIGDDNRQNMQSRFAEKLNSLKTDENYQKITAKWVVGREVGRLVEVELTLLYNRLIVVACTAWFACTTPGTLYTWRYTERVDWSGVDCKHKRRLVSGTNC